MTINPFLNLPVIGLGMAAIGRPEYINIKTNEPKILEKKEEVFQANANDLLNFAFERGIRYFDTAPGYGSAEKFLEDWKKHKEVDKAVIGSKWGYTYVANWKTNANVHEIKEHSLNKLNEQWEESKTLLPQLKVYQIHSATFESGVLENKEVLNRLSQLKNENNLLIGLTTSGENQSDIIEKAVDIQIDGQDLFDCFQVTYNILEQSTYQSLMTLKDRKKAIIIKEALANGRIFPNKNYSNYTSLYKKLNELASIFKVGVDAVALRFCIQKINPDIILSGASNKEHLKSNLKTFSVKLTKEELALLENEGVESKNYWSERKKLSWN